jgi:hypothetical protein
MLPDTDIDDVKKQKNAEYAKHINDPVLSSLKMEGIRLLLLSADRQKDGRYSEVVRKVGNPVKVLVMKQVARIVTIIH